MTVAVMTGISKIISSICRRSSQWKACFHVDIQLQLQHQVFEVSSSRKAIYQADRNLILKYWVDERLGSVLEQIWKLQKLFQACQDQLKRESGATF